MSDDDDRIYVCVGGWITQDGRFVDENESEKLSTTHPLGTVIYSGIVSDNGSLVFPSHSSSLSHIKQFITFLRNCGGFQIF